MLESTLTVAVGVLKVCVALGFVIFVHELGHFAVAKMCGVQCDKFFVGFDIGGYKISRKWGETEYGVGILPLGGYVKMMGQDDDPAKIAEQMKESQAAADAAHVATKEITGPSGEKYQVDRRSYLAKSVPQRMAIISAGVIMNLIFGFIFAMIAYGIGADYVPCVVGFTSPGSPAYMAGIEPGDEIVQINDRVNPGFGHLMQNVMLGDAEKGASFRIKKASTGEEKTLLIKPELVEEGGFKIGVGRPRSLELAKTPAAPGTPAADAGFQGGDKVLCVNGQPVEDYYALERLLARWADEPLQVRVQRTAKDKGASDQEIELTVQPTLLRRLGLRMTMGPLKDVKPGAPGDVAGLQAGDLITAINDRPIGASTNGDSVWDPSTLPYLLPRDEEELKFTVQRGEESLDLMVQPLADALPDVAGSPGTPMSLPTVGVTYGVTPEVVSVVSGSPASKELQPGDVVTSAVIILPEDSKLPKMKKALPFDEEHQNWPCFVQHYLQSYPADIEVELTVMRSEKESKVRLKPFEAEGVHTSDRGLVPDLLLRKREVNGMGDAAALAWDQLVNDMGTVFRVLQKIGSDQVPMKTVSGPLGILTIAYKQAESGWAPLLLFLAMLSANLAVLNFLPIPVLDGGHMVFLAWEGLTGRPANEKVVIALHMVGFLLLISLMVFALGNDIRNYFL